MPWTTDGSGHGIFAFVAAANLAKLGGYSDWRIPNLSELLSLLDYEATRCYPDATAFPNWQTGFYLWVATTLPSSTPNAYAITTDNSSLGWAIKTTNYFVALVRGG
jgi:hypothetical protein